MMGSAGIPTARSNDFGATVRRLGQLMRPERVSTLAVLLFALVGVSMQVVAPRVLGSATDIIVDGVFGTGIDTGRLRRTLSFAVMLYAAAGILQYGQGWLIAGVVQRSMHRLRRRVEEKIHRMPLSHVDGQPRGDLLSRVTNDIDNLAQSLQQSMSQLLASALTVLGVVIMMFTLSWLLALIALAIIPVSAIVVKRVSARAGPRFRDQWRHTGDLNGQVEEAFTGHALVKVFGRQPQVEEAFRATNDQLYRASFRAQFAVGVIQPTMMFLGNLNYVAIAVVGGLRVASGAMSIGDIQAFIQYSRRFTQPLTQMASMLNVLQSGIASAERVFELLDAPDQTPERSPVTDTAGNGAGRVVFADVRFAYDPDKPLIDGLSFVAEPGQTVAIVGPTGAGKTTLVNLLMRFYELDGGRITLDGRDIAEVARPELRAAMGMVLQDTWLFSGTIWDNIAYGRPSATDEEILAAARATYVDRFVRAFPDGYNTVIGEDGDTVSAGERQLITIARAFLADPTILILDEATSSVDTRTEVLIQEAMTALRAQRTSFVIAHRLSTIRDADIIVVMDGGAIVEQGNHDDLLRHRGAYWELFNAQFSGTHT